MPGRNSLVTVAFSNESHVSWRDWLPVIFPKGKKSVITSVQTSAGWVTMEPDANRGMFTEHTTTLSNKRGMWLRGPMEPSACKNDVRIPLLMLGHRRWEVSTWRVWVYRLIAAFVLGSIGYGIWHPLTLLMAFLPFLIRSPCTPKGLHMWVKKKGFVTAALRRESNSDDQALSTLDRLRQSSASEA